MSLEDLGNLGEAIGSLGIVITLAFLVLEMRWTRRESARQYRVGLAQSVMDLELAMMSSNGQIAMQKWDKVTSGLVENLDSEQLRSAFSDSEWNAISARMYHAVAHLDMLIAKKDYGIMAEEEFEAAINLHRKIISPLAIRAFRLEEVMLLPVRRFLLPLKE